MAEKKKKETCKCKNENIENKEAHECKCKSEKCDCAHSEETLKLQALSEKYLRLQAEFQNYQNRRELEIEKLFKYEGENIIKEILPILDNFERAIQMDDRDLSDEVSRFLSGFKMIYTNLMGILSKLEVKEIEVDGKEFDPRVSEAILMDEDKNKPSNVVLEVLQKGYMYKRRDKI